MLKYGRGLPVQTQEDLVFVDKLRENYEKERNLPPKGENIIYYYGFSFHIVDSNNISHRPV